MRLTPRRALAAYLVCGVCVAGIPVAATLATSDAALAALAASSSQCQPLPSAATPSPTASTQPELCVSVQASQSGITTGQAASYTVQVWAANGSASGVTVTLTGSPSGSEPDFTGRCPSGDGSATCTIGALATSLAPSTYQMQAQIPVAAGASVTSVTLTATADATTSPAMSVLPSAAEAVAVSAPAAAASTPPASPSPASTPSSPASPATVPAVAPGAATPTTASATATPSSASTSPVNPVGGILPVSPTPAAATVPSSAAGTGTPSASSFTLVITAGTAELAGAIVLGVVLLLVGTRLVRRRRLAVRGDAEEQGGTGTRQRRFWPLWPPVRWRPARREGKPGEATGALAQDGDSVSVHSGADPGAEHQS